MAAVRWTGAAHRHLRAIRRYIGQDSAVYAAEVSERIITAAKNLRQYPRLGRVVPEFGDDSLREIIVGNYRIVYRLLAGAVEILAVVHGSQDLRRRLRSDR